MTGRKEENMRKTNKYYTDIVKNEMGKVFHTKEGRKQAMSACNTIINRIKKCKAWGMSFCGDDALIEYYTKCHEILREEAKA